MSLRNLPVASLAGAMVLGLSLFGCGSGAPAAGGNPAEGGSGEKLTGKISIDGSSTVSPISEALAEEFMREHPGVDVTVATSGTGGGFKKFAAGEIDIAGASRPIEDNEIEAAKANGNEFVELVVAFDGLSVVVNPQNDFVDTLTVEQLKRIWEPNSKVVTWADVNPAWPAEKIKLYGAGTDSGTFDYFTKAIVGKEKASRTDYQASEDDNVLVQGVIGDKFSLGYFGYSYVEQNADKLKLVKIDAGNGGVAPSRETIADGTYQPLSRPLFWYVNRKSLDRPEVAGLIKFLTSKGSELIASTGYVPLPQEAYDLVQKHADEKRTGSLFKGAEIGVKITDILSRERANP
jgi:phosphate transport system substrate-binding protein